MGVSISSGFETSSEVPREEPESRTSFLAGVFQWLGIIFLAMMMLIASDYRGIAFAATIFFAITSIVMTIISMVRKSVARKMCR